MNEADFPGVDTPRIAEGPPRAVEDTIVTGSAAAGGSATTLGFTAH